MVLSNTSDKLYGVYFGKVLKHLPHGRCKIFIPVAYAESYEDEPERLPSARQASPLFAGSYDGNGVFTYPNIGSTVLCLFLNGDVNFPMYFASLLGGENAFGQYEIIKEDLREFNEEGYEDCEKVSERHLITSGKTHFEWFEKGKLSAIVEDPIRTICSVDYDTWEKNENNISTDNKYDSSLSNYNLSAIKEHKLSNIDCQLVLDNDGKAHGKLSTSTHWYDIIDEEDKKKLSARKGTISTDNWHIMDNNGSIRYGTLSTSSIDLSTVKKDEKTFITAYNKCAMDTNGEYLRLLSNVIKQDTDNKAKKLSTEIECSCSIFLHHYLSDFLAALSMQLDGTRHDLSGKKDVAVTSNISSAFFLGHEADFAVSSYEKIYTISSVNDNTLISKSKLTATLSTLDGNTLLRTLSDLNEIRTGDKDRIKQLKLDNHLSMAPSGEIDLRTDLDKYSMKSDLTDIESLKTNSGIKFNTNGRSVYSVRWHLHKNDSSDRDVDNKFTFDVLNKDTATVLKQITSLKKNDDSRIVDFNYIDKIEAKTNTATILIQDDIVKNEYFCNNDLLNGKTTVYITNKDNLGKCKITIDAKGKMTIETTDELSIHTSNKVKIETNETSISSDGGITMYGPTTINGTLHVTDATTIDADASIGTISFLGHFHTGNVGAPTSPPIG